MCCVHPAHPAHLAGGASALPLSYKNKPFIRTAQVVLKSLSCTPGRYSASVARTPLVVDLKNPLNQKRIHAVGVSYSTCLEIFSCWNKRFRGKIEEHKRPAVAGNCAASVLPLSCNNQTTTSPHKPLYVLSTLDTGHLWHP